MTINDPIVLLGIGTGLAVAGWVMRTALQRIDTRVSTLETAVSELRTQMAVHDGNTVLLAQMSQELRDLAALTHRIAGHLKVN